MVLKFDYCCGCVDLRTGCLIIGYLSLVGELIIIPFCALGLLAADAETEDGKNTEEEATELLGRYIWILSTMMLVLTILYIVFTIYLLMGLHQNKRVNIKAFIIFASFFVVLSFVIWLTEFFDPPVSATSMIASLSVILISLYSVLVIRSYYHKIDDQMIPLEVYSA